jgi:gliding motility-associated-like protein
MISRQKVLVCLCLILRYFFCTGQNLILNNGCESPLVGGNIPNWTEIGGTGWTQRMDEPLPHSGKAYFFPGVIAEGKLKQEINIAQFSCTIDQGVQQFKFAGFVRSFQQSPSDESNVDIQFFDATGSMLANSTLGPFNQSAIWLAIGTTVDAPVGARQVSIVLRSVRRNGSNNDGYYDDLSLVPLPATSNPFNSIIDVAICQGQSYLGYSESGTYIDKLLTKAGCDSTRTLHLTVKTKPEVKATSTSTFCNEDNGIIRVSAAGTGTIQYSLNGGEYQLSPEFKGLSEGGYKIMTRDSLGCEGFAEVKISKSPPPMIDLLSSVNASCNKNNGSVSVTASGGLGGLQYSLDNINFQTEQIFNDLSPGDYEIIVKDSAGCQVSMSADVEMDEGVKIDSVRVSDTTCNLANGSIAVGGSSNNAPMSYSIDNKTFQSSPNFVGLQPDNYTIWVKDQSDCMVSQVVTIKHNLKTLNRDVTICQGEKYVIGDSIYTKSGTYVNKINKNGICDSLVTTNLIVHQIEISMPSDVSIALGDSVLIVPIIELQGTYNYYWLPSDAISCDTCLVTWVKPTETATYTIRVETENYLCSKEAIIKVEVRQTCKMIVPDAFSPDGDGHNELLQIFGGDCLRLVNFSIYNRWGEVIYSTADVRDKWDGCYKGLKAEPGQYAYKLTTELRSGAKEVKLGSVLLIR